MIPEYDELYDEVLQVLKRHKEIRYCDLVKEVCDDLQLSMEDREATLENSKTRIIYYRIGWTKTYLTKAGLARSVRRGVSQISEEGKRLLSSGVHVTNEVLMGYEGFADFFRPKEQMEREDAGKGTSTPLESIDRSLKMISSRLSDELLEVILSKEPRFFEKLVLDLLEKMGYPFDKDSIIATSYQGDEGIDGIIKEDKFGFNSIYVQAKRWRNGSVGRPELQKFLGAVAGQGGTKGLFITTSGFTSEAIEFARKQLQVKLILVDGRMLTKLMMEYNLGVSVVKTYEVKQIDVDYFDGELM